MGYSHGKRTSVSQRKLDQLEFDSLPPALRRKVSLCELSLLYSFACSSFFIGNIFDVPTRHNAALEDPKVTKRLKKRQYIFPRLRKR